MSQQTMGVSRPIHYEEFYGEHVVLSDTTIDNDVVHIELRRSGDVEFISIKCFNARSGRFAWSRVDRSTARDIGEALIKLAES